MKQGSLLLLTLMGFFLYSGVATAEDLDAECSKYLTEHCKRTLDLHCGSDGETYGNKCFFCKEYYKSGRTLQLKNRGKCE